MNRLPDHLDEVDGNAAVAAYQDFVDAILEAFRPPFDPDRALRNIVSGPAILEHHFCSHCERLDQAFHEAAHKLVGRLSSIVEHPSRPARWLEPVRPTAEEERIYLEDAMRRALEEAHDPDGRRRD